MQSNVSSSPKLCCCLHNYIKKGNHYKIEEEQNYVHFFLFLLSSKYYIFERALECKVFQHCLAINNHDGLLYRIFLLVFGSRKILKVILNYFFFSSCYPQVLYEITIFIFFLNTSPMLMSCVTPFSPPNLDKVTDLVLYGM